jgi:hypothetical protein
MRHLDSVKIMKVESAYSVAENSRGQFYDPDFLNAWDELVSSGIWMKRIGEISNMCASLRYSTQKYFPNFTH